jgi:hypothetical protein
LYHSPDQPSTAAMTDSRISFKQMLLKIDARGH